jgi:hypothetical protein
VSISERLEHRHHLSASEDEADHVEFLNDLLEHAPDSWDGDDPAEAIALAYVRHLEAQVERWNGCLHPHCALDDGEPCDHGRP